MKNGGREGREGRKERAEGGREGGEGGGRERERDRERGRGGCRNVGMGVRWERRGKGNGKIIIMYMCLISSSDVYIHCAQVWYGWLVLLGAISIAWLPAPS